MGGRGRDKAVIEACNDLETFIKREITSAKECNKCYELSFKNDKGITIPCSKKHELVWAKSDEFCYFPAKLIHRYDDDSVSVRYFGDYTADRLNADCVRPYSETCPDAGATSEYYTTALQVCSVFICLCIFFVNTTSSLINIQILGSERV